MQKDRKQLKQNINANKTGPAEWLISVSRTVCNAMRLGNTGSRTEMLKKKHFLMAEQLFKVNSAGSVWAVVGRVKVFTTGLNQLIQAY